MATVLTTAELTELLGPQGSSRGQFNSVTARGHDEPENINVNRECQPDNSARPIEVDRIQRCIVEVEYRFP